MIRIVRRAPATCWIPDAGLAVIETGLIGFAGAAEDDRLRWLNSFRRLVDGLDAPLQVVITLTPGPDDQADGAASFPSALEDMRGADLSFANDIRQSTASHRFGTALITPEKHGARLTSVLAEMGIECRPSSARDSVFGAQVASCFRDRTGVSRTWYVERLPGTDIEPGWLFKLLPSGLKLSLSWHATPLPAAWIVSYLQRQLVNMRATRMQDGNDPALAGAIPNTEDLQRRLASSQDKAFHVSVYLTLTSPAGKDLERDSRKVEAAARAILCDLQPCTFRMLEGYLATRPGGHDRLQRRRVIDSTALVTFFPWNEPDLQQPGGLFVGRNAATGSPLLVDPFDQQRYANANVAVFGHSGAGKTYLLSTLVMGALGTGTNVYVIDPEHEYGGLAQQLGGIDVQLALGSGHALNVLDLRPADRRDESWLGPAAADAVDLCA
ncbi:MAG TPA: DUF87 domain-containing protein, partial [Candidatus Dormibacteraeota bacterium]|nr:DUF87 domain-containing protein [Candidatus Dormibacteraeota bacterium]